MNNEYANDFEVRKATLVKLGGDPTGLSNIYEVDLEILERTAQGGGGVSGATIDDTTISTTKVWSSSKTNSEITGSTQDMATKTWVGQQGYLTQHQSLSDYSTTAQMNSAISSAVATKQDTISDLSTIRSGAAAGATALQSVPSGYAKVVTLTQAQYDALAVKDSETIYIISDAE